MIVEIYTKHVGSVVGKRFRFQANPTPGARKINKRLYDATHVAPVAPPTQTTAPTWDAATPAPVGTLITVTPGTYSGGATITGQWMKGATTGSLVEIQGATGLTFTPQAGDTGMAIRYRETATNAGGFIHRVLDGTVA